MTNALAFLRTRLRNIPSLRRRAPLWARLVELAARVGYGARGFVYLSVGVLTLLAAANLAGDAVGPTGAIAWLAQQPLGRVWLFLLGLGLLAFVQWRMLQAVFDADHEGRTWDGISTRASQFFSGLGYAFLAFSAFSLLVHTPVDPEATEIAASHENASRLLNLPAGDWLLTGVGLCILGIGIANIVRAWREDFTAFLACSENLCRRVAPLARAGYMARGFAYLPLAILVVLAGWHAEPSDVTSFGAALETVERQPAGPWILSLAALGFIAFGAFSFIEGRFRRIRPPRELKPMA